MRLLHICGEADGLAHLLLCHVDADWSEEELREIETEADRKAREWRLQGQIDNLREAQGKLGLFRIPFHQIHVKPKQDQGRIFEKSV
jgi:hypothetical protein